MKYLSIVVPSYNAEKYLDRSIPSLIPGGDDVEVIIVNDGSKDSTLQIARSYEEKYPNIIKVIDKENGGHGSGVNAGIAVATGLYFKCVDADDWLDLESYQKFLDLIKKHHKDGVSPDLYLTDFTYNRLDSGQTHEHYCSHLCPPNKLLSWDDFHKPTNNNYFLMHSFTYKLDILKQSKLNLPEHTFYVDNLYVYQPLYYVKSVYYFPVHLYQYYVGREGQSISKENMAKNYKHAFRVYERVILQYSYDDIKKLSRKHKNYMLFSIDVIEALTIYYSILAKKHGAKKEFKEIQRKFRTENKALYNKIHFRTRFLPITLLIPPIRELAFKIGYKFVTKKTGWY